MELYGTHRNFLGDIQITGVGARAHEPDRPDVGGTVEAVDARQVGLDVAQIVDGGTVGGAHRHDLNNIEKLFKNVSINYDISAG